tara:strand:- start:2946 stop:5882 length:2937 start_codon:yes stop_codon:yes gene_type:complete
MKYILYIPGMPFDGNTLKDGLSLGGSETAGYYVAKELTHRGHEVYVFTNIQEGKQIDEVHYVPIGQATQEMPLGLNFQPYAQSVPSDVIIAQRVPGFFTKIFNSKVNLWWTHDLALRRSINPVNAQMWNTDRVLTVSQFHKDQVHEVYGIAEDFISLLPNGIDLNLFSERDTEQKFKSKVMIYSARPERGLENLVKVNGIMENLYKLDPEIKLIVCGYNFTTKEMAPYYQTLWDKCNRLPNVENYGSLSKAQLGALMSGAWINVYPTEFEETSCISAMEAQAAGNPFVSTKTGALPETLKDGGFVFAGKTKGGHLDIDKFTEKVFELSKNKEKYIALSSKAIAKSKDYTWKKSVDLLEEEVDKIFIEKTDSSERTLKHLVRNSDIISANIFMEKYGHVPSIVNEINHHYSFAFHEGGQQKHYDDVANYNINEIRNTHNLGNHQFHWEMPRSQPIMSLLSKLKAGRVLEYGCCVGQQTYAFAAAFPQLRFTGVDISAEQIKIGIEYKKKHNIQNVDLYCVDDPGKIDLDNDFDFIICAEVLEHIMDTDTFVRRLEALGRQGAPIVFTTPIGPHEENRWNEQITREHLHHFEDRDLIEKFGHKPGFKLSYMNNHTTKSGDQLGNFCFSWTCSHSIPIKQINYDRKFKIQNPRQSLSVCMIVKADGDSLAKTLKSIIGIADEIIIGIDGKEGQGRAWEIAKDFQAVHFKIESPLKTGFDVARNATIEKATKDWILWIDDDEVMQYPERILKFFKVNQYDSYAIHQNHFTNEPAGLLKQDLPCRIFRNFKGIKFYGVVHEHPETEINKGAGLTLLIPANEVCLMHAGYENEETRRNRFQRNWPLMQRDRKKYPTRELGSFLWIRDLAHINRFEFEKFKQITPVMIERGNEALEMWRKLVAQGKIRLIIDSLPYVTECVDLLTNGGGIHYEVGLGASFMGMGDKINGSGQPMVSAKFMNKEDIEAFTLCMLKEKTQVFEGKYL